MNSDIIKLIQLKSRVLTKAMHLETIEPKQASIEYLRSALLEYKIWEEIKDPSSLNSAYWCLIKVIGLETELDINDIENKLEEVIE